MVFIHIVADNNTIIKVIQVILQSGLTQAPFLTSYQFQFHSLPPFIFRVRGLLLTVAKAMIFSFSIYTVYKGIKYVPENHIVLNKH